jgi:hypothetical protein
MQRCLANADGRPDAYGNTYVSRGALEAGPGYAPQPLVGGQLLASRVPASLTALAPVRTDRFMNPALTLVVILVILVAILYGLYLSTEDWEADAPVRAARSRLAAHTAEERKDPLRGTPFELWHTHPTAAQKKIVEEYERHGACMKLQRARLGMAAGADC